MLEEKKQRASSNAAETLIYVERLVKLVEDLQKCTCSFNLKYSSCHAGANLYILSTSGQDSYSSSLTYSAVKYAQLGLDVHVTLWGRISTVRLRITV